MDEPTLLNGRNMQKNVLLKEHRVLYAKQQKDTWTHSAAVDVGSFLINLSSNE